MERENFYLLLALPFDPPETDPARIRAALHRKKQEWTRQQDHPAKRNAALRNLGLAPEIERVLLDPALRSREAEDAKRLAQEMLCRFEAELRILEGKGYILPKEAAAIAAKYRVYGVDKEVVERRARCPIALSAPNTGGEPSAEPLERAVARGIRRNLALLGLADLYAFLGQPPYSSIKKLTDAAEAKRRAAAGAKTSEAAISQELAGMCLQVFADFHAKQRYDHYLKAARHPLLCDMIDEEETRAQYISSTSLLRLVNFGVEACGLKVLEAEECIRRYCAAYHIAIDADDRYIACPACGAKTDGEAAVCRMCAAPLRGECPGCGAAFSHGAAVCVECGFELAKMGRALEYISNAQTALIENNWSNAQRNVQYAKKYWPGHPKLEAMEKRAHRLQERYARYIDSITDCVRHRQYYAAQELIQEAQARGLRLPAAMTEHVQRVVAEVEGKISALTCAGRPPEFAQVLALAELAADSMEVSRLLAQYPPEPPQRLRASVNGRKVRLDWSTSRAPGMLEYVLVRKQGGPPLTAFDGDILYEGPRHSFLDLTAEPLCEYHYHVYTKRSGAYSETGAATEPVLMIPEIEGLRIAPADGGAHLTWEFNPDVREVIIWRKLGGDRPMQTGEGIRLENTRLDGYTDTRIKNDVEYWYYLVAVYMVDGRKVYSHGVCDSVIPHRMVAPIDHLVFAKTDNADDEFVVNWMDGQHEDVLLLASPKKPAHTSGQVLPVDELLARYRRLDIEFRRSDSARFRCSFSGGLYIFAAAVYGRFATVGASSYLTNVRDVENVTYDLIADQLYLNMKWPAGLGEIVVCYRFDRFPKAPDETGATRLHYTREQYEYDAAVLLREPESMLYYFKIFSCFTAPDGSKTYSRGVELAVNNTTQQEVFYRLRYSRLPLASTGRVTLNLRANEPFTLPRAVLVGKVGRLPLGKNDGVVLFEIEKETRVKGEIAYQYQTAALPKNLYMRLFFQEDAPYRQFRLLPLSGLKMT